MPFVNRLRLNLFDGVWQKVSLNTLWLTLSRFIPQLLNLLFSIVIARQLGEVGLGEITWILAVLYIGNAISTFGMDTVLLRRVASENGDSTQDLIGSLLIQVGLALPFIIAVQLLDIPSPTLRIGLQIYSLSLLPLALTTTISSTMRGKARMDLIFLLSAISPLCQLLGAIYLLSLGYGTLAIVTLLLFTRILEAGTAWGLARFSLNLSLKYPIRIDHRHLRATLRVGFPLALLMTFSVAYQRAPILLSTWLGDSQQTGILSVATRLLEGGRALPYALFGSLMPLLVRRSQPQTKVDPLQGYRQGFWLFATAWVGGIALLMISAPWLIQLLFGPDYMSSVILLQIGALSLIPFLFSLRYSVELISAGHDRMTLAATGIGLLIAIPIMIAGYRLSTLPGLAWGMVISEFIMALLLWVTSWRLRA